MWEWFHTNITVYIYIIPFHTDYRGVNKDKIFLKLLWNEDEKNNKIKQTPAIANSQKKQKLFEIVSKIYCTTLS